VTTYEFRSAAEFWNEARDKLGTRKFGFDVSLDCPNCGAKDVFKGSDETAMDLFYCPKCDLCHVVQYEEGKYWMEQMNEPDLEPEDPEL